MLRYRLRPQLYSTFCKKKKKNVTYGLNLIAENYIDIDKDSRYTIG